MSNYDRRERRAMVQRILSRRPESADVVANPTGPLGNRGLARLLKAPGLEAQAERTAKALDRRPFSGTPVHQGAGPAAGGRAGRPLDAAVRGHFEAAFGQDLGNVRVHDDAGMRPPLMSIGAVAFAHGDDIAFAPGAYRPDTPVGRHLLAHEIAHVVQQRGGSHAVAGGSPALSPAPRGLQAQGDREALLARLKAVRARLAELRGAQARRSDEFTASMMEDRLGESVERGTRDLHAQARSDIAANSLWGGPRASRAIKRAVTVTRSGNLVTLNVNLDISYDGAREADGRKRAAADIPRIEAAIRDAWQVDITEGEYAGTQFRMAPRVSYLAPKAKRAGNAFLVRVRKPDTGPSSGDSVEGVISLSPAHLDGARVIVVAHELAHLFGFVDAYLKMVLHQKPGKQQRDTEHWAVGRFDANDRADLMGLIDPVLLERLHKQGAISDRELARQSGPVRVWAREASLVLSTLGVAPPAAEAPTIESEDFDPAVELGRIRDEGEKKLAVLDRKRRRVDSSIQWLESAEEVIRLEREEKELVDRLAALPASP